MKSFTSLALTATFSLMAFASQAFSAEAPTCQRFRIFNFGAENGNTFYKNSGISKLTPKNIPGQLPWCKGVYVHNYSFAVDNNGFLPHLIGTNFGTVPSGLGGYSGRSREYQNLIASFPKLGKFHMFVFWPSSGDFRMGLDWANDYSDNAKTVINNIRANLGVRNSKTGKVYSPVFFPQVQTSKLSNDLVAANPWIQMMEPEVKQLQEGAARAYGTANSVKIIQTSKINVYSDGYTLTPAGSKIMASNIVYVWNKYQSWDGTFKYK